MNANLFILFLSVILHSCKAKPDFEKEKQEIMKIHNNQRKAHMEKNVPLLIGDSLIEFFEINRGLIKKPSREESIKKFQEYFNAVDFVKWDDISAPIFSFSEDATMATTVVNKLVITKQKAENKLDTTYYAWLAVYKKKNGVWQMERMASTTK